MKIISKMVALLIAGAVTAQAGFMGFGDVEFVPYEGKQQWRDVRGKRGGPQL